MGFSTTDDRNAWSKVANVPLFLRRWAADPLQMGSILPSSRWLSRRMAALAVREAGEGPILELGAGTGVFTRALLAAGVAPERITVLEIEAEMAQHLRASLPRGVTVIEGDAFDLPRVLPRLQHGAIGSVICGVPLVLLPRERQARFVAAVQAVAPGRGFLTLTYCVTSPLPWRELGLTARRAAFEPRNVPPASIWHYRPA